VLRTLLERDDWHGRLLHGSDYPLPGIPILTRPQRLAEGGLLDAAAVPVLLAIREHNPLLFDFVLKRSLRFGGRGWPAALFETRRHVARSV
jgi:mannonate dehydratase